MTVRLSTTSCFWLKKINNWNVQAKEGFWNGLSIGQDAGVRICKW